MILAINLAVLVGLPLMIIIIINDNIKNREGLEVTKRPTQISYSEKELLKRLKKSVEKSTVKRDVKTFLDSCKDPNFLNTLEN